MPEYRYASGCLIIPWGREASGTLSSALMTGNPFVGSFNAVGHGGSCRCGRRIANDMLGFAAKRRPVPLLFVTGARRWEAAGPMPGKSGGFLEKMRQELSH